MIDKEVGIAALQGVFAIHHIAPRFGIVQIGFALSLIEIGIAGEQPVQLGQIGSHTHLVDISVDVLAIFGQVVIGIFPVDENLVYDIDERRFLHRHRIGT